MVKVVGVWERGWSVPILEWDLWELPLRDMGVEEFCMTPITGIDRAVCEAPDIATYVKANPTYTPIYIDEAGATDLEDFVHPENALYIFGRTSHSPWAASDQKGISVRVRTVNNLGLPMAHQIALVVLYDRMRKSWQSQ